MTEVMYINHSVSWAARQVSSFSNISVTSPTSQLILQPFRHFTYVTAHSPTLPSLHLRHSSFCNPSVALPTSQHILQPFRCFTYILHPFFRFSYVTGSSLTSPGESPMFNIHLLYKADVRIQYYEVSHDNINVK